MLRTSYPSTRLLVNNNARGVITFAGGASSNILVPGKEISSNGGPLVDSSNLTNTATSCPGFYVRCNELPTTQKVALMLTPVLLGTANDSGSNDAAGKSAVVSIVSCNDISGLPPRAAESSNKWTQTHRTLLAQLRFTGDSGTGLALASTTLLSKLCSESELATYTAASARAVMCSSATVLSGMLLPTNLIQDGANTFGFDIGTADALEIYVSCVADVTGTPARSTPAFAALVNFLLL